MPPGAIRFPGNYPPHHHDLIHCIVSEDVWTRADWEKCVKPWSGLGDFYGFDWPDLCSVYPCTGCRVLTFNWHNDSWRLGEGFKEWEIGGGAMFVHSGPLPLGAVLFVTPTMTPERMAEALSFRRMALANLTGGRTEADRSAIEWGRALGLNGPKPGS